MGEVLQTAWITVAKRPYVFLFFAVYLVCSWVSLGKWRTLLFLLVAFPVALASEYSSIRNGFPYGHYWYVYDSFDPHELILFGRPPPGSPEGTPAGVPFFDSLSYVFLAYASYELALFFASPTHVRGSFDLQLATTGAIRRSWGVWALATFFMGLIDVIIDPVAFQGKKWFLGRIYGYAEKGHYFLVPFSNQAGWWLVAAVTFALVIVIDSKLIASDPVRDRAGIRDVPLKAVIGPGIWLGVAVFQTSIAFWIEEHQLGFANTYITTPIAVLILARALGVQGRASESQLASTCPQPPLS